MSYRAYEDRNGLLKHFTDNDLEFEVIVVGLDSLKGSKKWGAKAKELERRFLDAFDGLISHSTPKCSKGVAKDSLIVGFLEPFRAGIADFKACDQLAFRKVHDECIRFFKDVRDAYSILMADDKRTMPK